ncbi:hypothetical protein GLOIN_2v1766729 [Rhizophagus irregularis DAOM 181602=DAOM 197198]|nr:hypothetical protein GLOIN_2v1766729 [Rhizophagus irregularis DAOM 181602=DAOM 197198]
MKRKLTEYQYVCQHLTDSTLVAKNFYSYFDYTSLSDGIDALQNILKSLRDDAKFRNIAEGYLKRDNFFRNDKIDFYFMRKERKMKEKRTTEKTLTMANERNDLATDIVHNNLLNSLNKVTNNLEENEDDAKSSTPPVKVDNNRNTQANNLPCYLDQIPLHAEYSHIVLIEFEDLYSLSEMKALCINGSVSYERTMWERIEMELNNVNVENLGFDHPICSGNHVILDICKDFIQKKESKINEDEDLGNIDYRKWIDHFKKLKKITKQMLELLVICLQGTSTIDKHSDEQFTRKTSSMGYIGEEGSSASAIQKDSHKIA